MASQKSIMQRRIMGASALAIVAGTILFSGNGSSVERGMRNLQSNFEYDKSEIKNLPDWTDVIANVWDVHHANDVPFFWYVPKSGGLTFHDIIEECLTLKIASTKGDATGSVSLLTLLLLVLSPMPSPLVFVVDIYIYISLTVETSSLLFRHSK
jgi:hypothetical protein